MKKLIGVELRRHKKSNPKHNKDIVIILENIQYARNVASIFRLAEATKVSSVILTGISHKPPFGKELSKVSRGKESSVNWKYYENTSTPIAKLKKSGYKLVGIETTDVSESYKDYNFPHSKIALVIGNENYTITKKTLDMLDDFVYVPVFGKNSSLNITTKLSVVLFKLVE